MPINPKRLILQATSMWIVFSMLLVLSNTAIAQTSTIKGRVTDSITSAPIAFAGVVSGNNNSNTSLTNIDGYFTLKTNKTTKIIKVLCVGYKTSIYNISDTKHIDIRLQKDTISIAEVTIYPTANPAHRIIEKAIENKEQNNPDNINAFSCRLYNKAVINIGTTDALKADTAVFNRINRMRDTMHLLVNESVSDRYYKAPGKVKEIINAVKLSGFSNPSITIQSTNFQPFHVYSDYISLISTNFLNPISKGSTQRYYFEIKDTLYDQSDTIYIINFRPRKNTNFAGLEGSIGINTNRYAIQTFKAKPSGESLWDIGIEQQYQFVNEIWFPKELNYNLKVGVGKFTELYNGKCYIDSLKLGEKAIANIQFDGTALSFADTASKAGTAYWQISRHDSLDEKDKRTYRTLDIRNKDHKLDRMMNLMNGLANLEIPIKYVNLDLSQLVSMNDFEQYRMGIAIQTNRSVSKHFYTGSYFAYGTQDKAWKYGGNAGFWIAPDHFSCIDFSYKNDIIEPGPRETHFNENKGLQNDLSFYNFFRTRMDKFEEYRISARYKYRFWRFYTSAQTQSFEPQYMFTNITLPKINITELSFSLRFCYGEIISKMFEKEVSLGSIYPTVYLHVSQGLTNVLKGLSRYTRLQADITQSFLVRNLGETNISVSSGIVTNDAPYQKQFIGLGSNSYNYPFYSNNMFQTMRMGTFTSSRFVNLFFEHNFKTLLLKTKYFSPEIAMVHNIGFGKLDNKQPQSPYLQDYRKGYFEGGLLIRNIFKFNYANFIYIGLGGGAFYNYGPYAQPTFDKNTVYKLSFTASFTK